METHLLLRWTLLIIAIPCVWGTAVKAQSALAIVEPSTATTENDLRQPEADLAETLMARVGEPSRLAVDEFKKAGMQGVTPHSLTAEERTKIEAALGSLPALNKRVLEKKLHSLAFVDGIPGEGTGLTSPDEKTGLYDITLRASIVDEPLSTFLTTKERRVFTDDGSGTTVIVTGTGTNALTYVLLHESSHVLDKGCGITADPHSRFTNGIWSSKKEMLPSLAAVAPTTYFRGGSKMPARKAEATYDALSQTPFVSLYATASELEDFAELVAWHEILKQHQGNLSIEVTDAHGRSLKQWEPLAFPNVQRRFVDVEELLTSQAACRTFS